MAEASRETQKCPVTILLLYFSYTALQTVNPLACYRLMTWHNRLLDAKPDPKWIFGIAVITLTMNQALCHVRLQPKHAESVATCMVGYSVFILLSVGSKILRTSLIWMKRSV